MKTSFRRTKANRLNAKKSTGPKTAAGKIIASRNALKHGLYAATDLLADENSQEFQKLARWLYAVYQPRDRRELELVRFIVQTEWRLRRSRIIESQLLHLYSWYNGERRDLGTAAAQDSIQGDALSKLVRRESLMMHWLDRAKKELAALQARPAAPAGDGGGASAPEQPGAAILEGGHHGQG
jgi:hypothetical protein